MESTIKFNYRIARFDAVITIIRLRFLAPLDDELWEKTIRIEEYLLSTLNQ